MPSQCVVNDVVYYVTPEYDKQYRYIPGTLSFNSTTSYAEKSCATVGGVDCMSTPLPAPPPPSPPPVHEPPFHEPPVYEPPVHEPPVHEPPANEPPVHEDGNDNTMWILIGAVCAVVVVVVVAFAITIHARIQNPHAKLQREH